MASRQADVSSLPLHPADKPIRAASSGKIKCIRCKEAYSTITVQTTKFCTPCFEYAFCGKVRPVLEQAQICAQIHRTEQPGGSSQSARAALGFSGGANSRALLRFVRERILPPPGYDPARGKPHEIYAVDVIYVEDFAIIRDGVDRTEEVRAIVEEEGGGAVGLHFVPLRLEDAFEGGEAIQCEAGFSSPRVLDGESITIEAKQALLQLFATLRPAKTPRTALGNARSRAEDLHRLLIRYLLHREACRRNDSCLLTGETATRRAIRTIEGMARGRGFKMSLEDAPFRWRNVFMLRPLSDVSSKEVAFHLRANGMDYLVPQDPIALEMLNSEGTYDSGSKASIGRLTESLIHLLDSNVASTISTVNRTAAKLVFHEEAASHEAINDDEQKGDTDNGFERIGPSMRLRRREEAQRGQLDQVEHDMRGMGLGGQGARNYITIQAWPRYDGKDECPMCQMPAQQGLQAWREGLTVTKVKSTNTSIPIPSTSINLSELLCYACNLLLDTPENTEPKTKMPLPTFVRDLALRRLSASSSSSSSS